MSICSSIFKKLQTDDFKNRKIVKLLSKIKRLWNFECSNRSFCDFVKSKIDCYDNDDCLHKFCWKILNERFVDSLKLVNSKDCKHDLSIDDIIVDVVKNEIAERSQFVLSKNWDKTSKKNEILRRYSYILFLHAKQKKKQKNFKQTEKKQENFKRKMITKTKRENKICKIDRFVCNKHRWERNFEFERNSLKKKNFVKFVSLIRHNWLNDVIEIFEKMSSW